MYLYIKLDNAYTYFILFRAVAAYLKVVRLFPLS